MQGVLSVARPIRTPSRKRTGHISHTKEKGPGFGNGALKEDGERLTRPFSYIDGPTEKNV